MDRRGYRRVLERVLAGHGRIADFGLPIADFRRKRSAELCANVRRCRVSDLAKYAERPDYETASTGVASCTGSIHFPCSRIKSLRRSTASASGMLNFTAV